MFRHVCTVLPYPVQVGRIPDGIRLIGKDVTAQNINLNVFRWFHRGRTRAETSWQRHIKPQMMGQHESDPAEQNLKALPPWWLPVENVSCHMLLLFWVEKFELHIPKLKCMEWKIQWRKMDQSREPNPYVRTQVSSSSGIPTGCTKSGYLVHTGMYVIAE